ncbi:MAG: sugar phosphate nucleotidyltransferase [Geminicoccaceae bacterium]
MKVVLFCGGLGMRLREYSERMPKPMVPIGHQPILWHVMQYYSRYGYNEFILCLGYKANVIRDYFVNYKPHAYSDVRVITGDSTVEILEEQPPQWNIALINTGLMRNIGERLYAVQPHVATEKIFLANYSDGLTDAPLDDMLRFFKESGKIACFLAVQPQFSYHLVDVDDQGHVIALKTSADSNNWINGGYFLFRQEIFDYIQPGEELVEEPFARLIAANQFVCYRYRGFWASMDTLKDKQTLEEMVERGDQPWMARNAKGHHDKL